MRKLFFLSPKAHGLAGVLSATVAFLALALLAILMVFVFRSYQLLAVETDTRQMEQANTGLTAELDAFLEHWHATLRVVAASNVLQEFLQKENADSGKNFQEELEALLTGMENLKTAVVLDSSGKSALELPEDTGISPAGLLPDAVRSAILSGEQGVSALPVRSPRTQQWLLPFYTPVRDNGKILGGLIFWVGMDRLFAEKTAWNNSVLLTKDGQVVLHPDTALTGSDFSGNTTYAPVLSQPDGHSLSGDESRILAWKQLPGTQWLLVSSIPNDNGLGFAWSQSNPILFGGAAGVLLLLCTVLWVIKKQVAGPVRNLMAFTGAISQDTCGGKLAGTYNFELAQLAENITAIVASLHESVCNAHTARTDAEKGNLRAEEALYKAKEATNQAVSAKAEGMMQAAARLEDIVRNVDAASSELVERIEHTGNSTEDQSARASESASAMVEMNAAIFEVAKNAASAASLAESAKAKAQEGAGIVQAVGDEITKIDARTREMKGDVDTLGKRAQEIGEVIDVISDIADQTNLLALNAAIEAARAGEAGRGFAVVADEVRKLAEKTQSATKVVADSIMGIQASAQKNMAHVDQAVASMEATRINSTASAAVLDEIVQLVASAASQVSSIATASEEQSAASEEVTQAIETVSTISATNNQTMQEANASVATLNSQVAILRGLINDMQVNALDEFLERWRSEVEFIAKTKSTQDYILEETRKTTDAVHNTLKQTSLKSGLMEAVFIFNLQGKTRILYNQGNEGPPLDLHDRPFVHEALAGKPGATLKPYQSRLSGNYLVVFSYPLYKNGTVAGGLGISITVGENLRNYLGAHQ